MKWEAAAERADVCCLRFDSLLRTGTAGSLPLSSQHAMPIACATGENFLPEVFPLTTARTLNRSLPHREIRNVQTALIRVFRGRLPRYKEP